MKACIENFLDSLKNKKSGLKQIILVLFTITAMAATLMTGISFYKRMSRQLDDTVSSNALAVIDQVGSSCDSYIRNMMKISNTLYYTVIKNNDIESKEVNDAFQLIYDANKDYIESVSIFTVTGDLLQTAPAQKLNGNITVRNEEWYKFAMSSRENMHFCTPVVSHLFNAGTEHSWCMPFSRVVLMSRNNNVIQGIMVINLKYSGLRDILDGVHFENGAYLYVTDSRNNIIYHPEMQLLSSGIVKETDFDAANHRDGVYKEKFMGRNRKLIVNTVGYTGWKIVGVVPEGETNLNVFKNQLFIVFMVLFLFTVIILINGYISKRVTEPLLKLEESVKELEEGNWDTEIPSAGFYEVRHLASAIRNMVGHIKNLMRDIVYEHEQKRKTELTALQNQINPHFLYNTLDIIVWMIENEQKQDAVRAVTALARFFRISLSGGKNIITVEAEVEHVRNYLTIQEMRFKNKFHYKFNVEEDVKGLGTIKLILQPIVENAVYHAMEFMDGDGEINVKVWRQDDDLFFLISDNGQGMDEETLTKLVEGKAAVSSKGSGVGVRNVNERIKLMFGGNYGITIKSEPDCGTDVTIKIPAISYEELKKRGESDEKI